ncbi:hypothetical protein CYMTET_40438 [Cymbomonas tetramitiformis]|uniref:Uncharacterized protein n=1 Tax=Cymbomonas tetramitiformis TaxID=36881 RepID=A0AAE0F4M2_9CHLO|nr:hypothetical protein CYMTET_40438 [Cymbomonas tetramitiformis]
MSIRRRSAAKNQAADEPCQFEEINQYVNDLNDLLSNGFLPILVGLAYGLLLAGLVLCTVVVNFYSSSSFVRVFSNVRKVIAIVLIPLTLYVIDPRIETWHQRLVLKPWHAASRGRQRYWSAKKYITCCNRWRRTYTPKSPRVTIV